MIISQWEIGKQEKCLRCGKTRVTKSRLFWVLNPIGWENRAGVLDQSQSKVEWNQSKPGILNWNCPNWTVPTEIAVISSWKNSFRQRQKSIELKNRLVKFSSCTVNHLHCFLLRISRNVPKNRREFSGPITRRGVIKQNKSNPRLQSTPNWTLPTRSSSTREHRSEDRQY